MDMSWCFAAVVRAAISTAPLFCLVAFTVWLGEKRFAPWARQALWSLVLVRLMLPVSYESPWSLQPQFAADIALTSARPEFDAHLDESQTQVRLSATEIDERSHGDVGASHSPLAPMWSWSDALESLVTAIPWVVIGGTIVVAVWTLATTVRLGVWVRSAKPYGGEDVAALIAEGQRRLGVSGTVRVRTLVGLSGPATYGWWSPIILLPDDVVEWSAEDRRHVLWHELAHVKRYDVLLNWCLAVVRALHWWNPVFWIAERFWLAERELACDALVVRQLGERGAQDYGETLLKFIARLSNNGLSPAFASPGFVAFWRRKSETRRRIAQLSRLAAPEGKLSVWVALGLLAGFAWLGLSDAKPESVAPARLPPIAMPAETRFVVAPSASPDVGQYVTLEHDLKTTLDRICADQEIGRELGRQDLLRMLCGFGVETLVVVGPSETPPATGGYLSAQGDMLVARTTPARHEAIRELLDVWSQQGWQQIAQTFRFGVSSHRLADLFPGAGGEVIAVGGTTAEALVVADVSLGKRTTSQSVSAFRRVLTNDELPVVIAKLQSDRGSDIFMAPKVTTFSGQAAVICDTTARPFITSLRSAGAGALEPLVTVETVGTTIRTRATPSADGKFVRLSVEVQESQIDNVDVASTTLDGARVNVQVPDVSRSVVAAEAILPDGHTLAVVPLRRDAKGRLRLHLFTAKIVPKQTEKAMSAEKTSDRF